MKLLTLVLILAALPLRALALSLPDSDLTPGSTLTVPVKVLCKPGYSKLVRHTTTATKRRVCEAYHRAFCPGPAWALDHKYPLECGGADVAENLWPQPALESKLKDKDEAYCHKQICSGHWTIKQAKEFIDKKWGSKK